jgi:hypothetical protein
LHFVCLRAERVRRAAQDRKRFRRRIFKMRYRTLVLFLLMFGSAVGAAIIPAIYDNVWPMLLFIAFPVFSAMMFTSIVFDIMYPQPEPHRALS